MTNQSVYPVTYEFEQYSQAFLDTVTEHECRKRRCGTDSVSGT